MSSMRNAVQRRNHKERAQPLERQKWGLLEKRKDYTLRAKDHNEKKKRLRSLRQKAAERNPDEFAFGMMSSTTKKGIKVQQRGLENGTGAEMSPDMIKLLKTQDVGYLQTILQQTKREKERLGEDKILTQHGISNETPTLDLNRRKQFDEDGHEIARLHVRTEIESEDDNPKNVITVDKTKLKAQRSKRRMVDVLKRRITSLGKRERVLDRTLEAAQMQRARMNGNIGGENRSGIKFKVRERKR